LRIGEDAKKCVVFFGVAGEGPMDNAGIPVNISYGGTGFLAAYNQNGFNVPYIITCRHVAELLSKHPEFYIRANTIGGESYTLNVRKMDWAYHPDETVDLAAASYELPSHIFDVIYYRLNAHTTVFGEQARSRVYCGEAISLIGLFRLHPGKQRNISFVHTGSVAVLPDELERIPLRDRTTGKTVEAEVYLVEAQTLDGLSGSPAFVHEVVDLPEFTLSLSSAGHPKAFGAVRLLGLYTGSWDGQPGQLLAADRDLQGQTRVPVGVGTVVPADRIRELLEDHPRMKKQRKDYIGSRPYPSGPWTASQDSAIPSPPTGDANPKHREDFNSLSGAAVKKPARED
jgi:hypothetical protein